MHYFVSNLFTSIPQTDIIRIPILKQNGARQHLCAPGIQPDVDLFEKDLTNIFQVDNS